MGNNKNGSIFIKSDGSSQEVATVDLTGDDDDEENDLKDIKHIGLTKDEGWLINLFKYSRQWDPSKLAALQAREGSATDIINLDSDSENEMDEQNKSSSKESSEDPLFSLDFPSTTRDCDITDLTRTEDEDSTVIALRLPYENIRTYGAKKTKLSSSTAITTEATTVTETVAADNHQIISDRTILDQITIANSMTSIQAQLPTTTSNVAAESVIRSDTFATTATPAATGTITATTASTTATATTGTTATTVTATGATATNATATTASTTTTISKVVSSQCGNAMNTERISNPLQSVQRSVSIAADGGAVFPRNPTSPIHVAIDDDTATDVQDERDDERYAFDFFPSVSGNVKQADDRILRRLSTGRRPYPTYGDGNNSIERSNHPEVL